MEASKFANAEIREHLQDEPLNSAGAYARQLVYFDLVKDGMFEMVDVAADQFGNEMVILRLCTDEQLDTVGPSVLEEKYLAPEDDKDERWPHIVNFHTLAHYCVRRRRGAYIATEDNLGVVRGRIKYGAIWSYCEYGELGGNDIIREQYEKALSINLVNPFEALVGESGEVMFSYPSEYVLSNFLKELLTEVIEEIIPDAKPEFLLRTEKRYALPHSICVDLGKELPEELEHKITDTLMFYVPPYLPIHVDSSPKQIDEMAYIREKQGRL